MSVRSRAQLEVWVTFLSVALIAVVMALHNPTFKPAASLTDGAARAGLRPTSAPLQIEAR